MPEAALLIYAIENARHVGIVAVADVAYTPVIIATSVNSRFKMLAEVVNASAISQIKAGKLRPLAVTTAVRSSSFPNVPTVAELGCNGFDVGTWHGIFMPAHTPKEVVDLMNRKVSELLATPDMKAAIQAQGAEPLPMIPQRFSTAVNDDHHTWESIVKAAGATIE